MSNVDEQQHLTGNFVYTINSDLIKIFRTAKILYTCLIIIMLSVMILYDNHSYSSGLINIVNTYLFCESIGILIYAVKIRNIRARWSMALRVTSTLIRFWWIILTIYGLQEWFTEDDTTNSPLYYASAYVFISNIVYIGLTICFGCFGCLMYCFMSSLTNEYPGDESRNRTIVHLVDDISDLQLFSNVLKMNQLYQQTTCVICFENFNNNDQIRILNCNHYFHDQCINEWLTKNPNCPVCRNDVEV